MCINDINDSDAMVDVLYSIIIAALGSDVGR